MVGDPAIEVFVDVPEEAVEPPNLFGAVMVVVGVFAGGDGFSMRPIGLQGGEPPPAAVRCSFMPPT